MGRFSLQWHRREVSKGTNPVIDLFNDSLLISQLGEHPKEFCALWLDMAKVIRDKYPDDFKKIGDLFAVGITGGRTENE